jgi:hypothetical protein
MNVLTVGIPKVKEVVAAQDRALADAQALIEAQRAQIIATSSIAAAVDRVAEARALAEPTLVEKILWHPLLWGAAGALIGRGTCR